MKKKNWFLTIIAIFIPMLTLFFSSLFILRGEERIFASVKNVTNNVIFVNFSGENEYVNEVPFNYSSSLSEIIEYSYNDSDKSVKQYFSAVSNNRFNMTADMIYETSTPNSYNSSFSREELLVKTPNNPNGYLQYEVVTYSSNNFPSQLSIDYLMNTNYQFATYDCSYRDVHDFNYVDDGVCCMCEYDNFVASNPSLNITMYDHIDGLIKEQLMLREVLAQCGDFFETDYDYDNDGYIDALTFLFPFDIAMYDEVCWSEILWPHQSSIINLDNFVSGYPNYLVNTLLRNFLTGRCVDGTIIDRVVDEMFDDITIQGKKVMNYNLMPTSDVLQTVENTNIIRDGNNNEISDTYTFAHELSHVLGLPDLYDYTNTSEVNPMGYWDLMHDSYFGSPVYYTSYFRQKMGFIDSTNITKITNEGTYSLKPVNYDELYNNNNLSNRTIAYTIESSQFPDQIFYLEFRQNTGNFESGASRFRNEGLIVYRVDKNITTGTTYDDSVAIGNYYAEPFSVCVITGDDDINECALNDTNKTLGNSDKNSLSNAITYQSYDQSKNQAELDASDVTYVNSGLVITNVKIENGILSFDISGGELEKEQETVDLSSVGLIGDSEIQVEVNSSYTDAGINFGDFTESDFDMIVTNNINFNVIGNYQLTYKLTHKASGTILTLTRIVNVVDLVKPTIVYNGSLIINVSENDNLSSILSQIEIDYYDNYDIKSNLTVDYNLIKDSGQVITSVDFIVKDSSNNESKITFTINYVDYFSSIALIGERTLNVEVGSQYVDLGVDLSGVEANDYLVESNLNSLDTSICGEFIIEYTITHIPSGEVKILNRVLNISDFTAPTVQLVGNKVINIYVGDFYRDEGINYGDNYDATTALVVESNLNSLDFRVVGEKIIVYTVTDSSNNYTTITRTVNVLYKPYSSEQILVTVLDDNFGDFKTFYLELLGNINNNLSPNIEWFINGELVQSGGREFVLDKNEYSGKTSMKILVDDLEVYNGDFSFVQEQNYSTIIIALVLILVVLTPILWFVIRKMTVKVYY